MSGLGYGSVAILKGVFNGVTGVVVEPVKGAQRDGFKGAAKGFAAGIIGVVTKPIAGSVGFVQCSVQGAVNTPGTIKNLVK